MVDIGTYKIKNLTYRLLRKQDLKTHKKDNLLEHNVKTL